MTSYTQASGTLEQVRKVDFVNSRSQSTVEFTLMCAIPTTHNNEGDLNGSEVQDIGLSHQDLVDLQGNWTANMAVVKAAIVEHNGFVWQDMVCVGDGK